MVRDEKAHYKLMPTLGLATDQCTANSLHLVNALMLTTLPGERSDGSWANVGRLS